MKQNNKTNWWRVTTIALMIVAAILLLCSVDKSAADKEVWLGDNEGNGFYVNQAFLQTTIDQAIELGWENLTITEIATNKSITISL